MRRAALAAVGIGAAGRAEAHAFDLGAGAYVQFVEGAGVVLALPGLLLPLVALGIAISLWDTEGLPRVWPMALAGQAAGLILAPLMGPGIAAGAMALGAGVAALAALWPGSHRAVIATISTLTGLFVTLAAFEGHGLFELPLAVHAGVIFAVNLVLAAGAGAAALALERWPAGWMRLGWRIVASWLGAVLVLMLALALGGGVS
jgi:hypothetical protein